MNNMPNDTMNRTKIVVIEDDRDINELIAYNLRKERFYVEQEFNGLEAKKSVEEKQFDIVILDIMLPGIDGFDICKDIKDEGSEFFGFVIIISAKSNPQDKLCAHILGADYYLTKPFVLAELISVIKELDSLMHKKFAVTVR